MALINKQYLADRLATRYGLPSGSVRVGLSKWIEDVRDASGSIVSQIFHNDGEKFTRLDGVAIPQADIDAETPAASADELSVLQAAAAENIRENTISADVGTDAFFDKLKNATPTDIRAWVQTNVNDLPSAKVALAKLAVAVAFLLGQIK